MAITDRVHTAFQHYCKHEDDNALLQISSAIDTMAKVLYGSKMKVGPRTRKYLQEHFDVISTVAMFVTFKGGTIGFAKGSFEQLIYEGVRCALSHDSELEDYVSFEDGFLGIRQEEGGRVVFGRSWILALIASVIVADVKKSMNLEFDIVIPFKSGPISFAKFQGDKEAMFEAYKHIQH